MYLQMVDYVADLLAKALAQVFCVVNPQVYVIGGGMSKAGDILLNAIQAHYKEYAFHACRKTAFKVAELSNDAGMVGGVHLILG